MPRPMDLTGKRFGRLVAIAPVRVSGKYGWRCRCDCGRVKDINAASLRAGRTRSCGCRIAEITAARARRHGGSGTPEHEAWCKIWGRCSNPRNAKYHLYGARGIAVCDRWRGEHGFENFLADMGPRPSPAHSIDRIDVNGNYEPGNCRWATPREQSNNTRFNRRITASGETLTIADWGRRTGLGEDVIQQRLRVLGWSEEDAVLTPILGGPRKAKR